MQLRTRSIPRHLSWSLAGTFTLLGLVACGGPPGGEQRAAPQVLVRPASAGTASVIREYSGRIHGAREVEVRARVEGIIVQRLYDEGQVVEQNQPLFQIDPDPYRLALDRAQAERANAQALLNQAEREWRRISGLYEQAAISTRDFDRAKADLELSHARLAQAQAAVGGAALNLEWTAVAAPVAGMTSLEALSEGNLISQGTLLTRIVQMDPVQLRFSLPEDDAQARRAAIRNATSQDAVSSQVTLIFPDGTAYEHPGRLDFTDGRVDPGTGSVPARAMFPNPTGSLLPGQFMRVRVQTELLHDVYRVPPGAVRHGRQGPQLFIVSNDAVQARSVQLGPVVNGEQIILDGLENGDLVVVSGLAGLRDGLSVRMRQAEPESPGG